MDACRKFGEHERSVRVALGDSREQLKLLVCEFLGYVIIGLTLACLGWHMAYQKIAQLFKGD